MPRPTKYTPERVEAILTRLRQGNTRRAACLSNGISEDTLANWIASKSGFSDSVARAEMESESRNVALIARAAAGQPSVTRTRTVKTVFKVKKTKYPDGKIVEEPISFEEVTEQVVESEERDWRAGLELIKRRNRPDWGDHQIHGVDSEIREFLAILGSQGQDQAPERAQAISDLEGLNP